MSTYQKILSPSEIADKTGELVRLISEQGVVSDELRKLRNESRQARAHHRELSQRIAAVHHEVRTGQAAVPRQQELPVTNGHGIDGASDEPDPETDPPGAPGDKFFQLYPPPKDHASLVALLLRALGPEQEKLCRSTVESWHPDSGIFAGAGWWARVEVAHQEGPGREPIAGLTLPVRYPMPRPLKEALGASLSKAKAGKKTRRVKA